MTQEQFTTKLNRRYHLGLIDQATYEWILGLYNELMTETGERSVMVGGSSNA